MNFILIHLCIVKEFLYDETVVLPSCAFDAVLLAVLAYARSPRIRRAN